MSNSLVIALVCTFFIFVINSEVVKRSVCKENEMHVECVHCGPKTCDDLGYPSPCGGATGRCRPECVCVDGHVRDANGTCIPKKECPGCGDDRNATSGCGNHCGNSCSDYMEHNKTCLTGCRYNSCDCRPGYVYNDAIRKCVLPVDCFVSSPKGILLTDSESKTCETKLYSCSIKMDYITVLPGAKGEMGAPGLSGPMGVKGQKGEKGSTIKGPPGPPGLPGTRGSKGEQGLNGRDGEKGFTGVIGLTGVPGLRGEKGEKGDSGIDGNLGPTGQKGEMGPPGVKGEKGLQGDVGPQGVRGYDGYMGPKGDMGMKGNTGEPGEKGEKSPPGQKGERGLPGLQGLDGSCSCSSAEEKADDGDVDDVLSSCKYAKKDTVTGKYMIYEKDPFEVICDMEKNRTCIPTGDRANISEIDTKSFTHKTSPFWVSELRFDLHKLYRVNLKQLEFLQSKSTSTSLELIYHCKNSYIIPKDKKVDGALRLMSWKETVIGPAPSEKSPHFYSVLTEDDGCENSGDHKLEWKQSTIRINSRLKILPVSDFYIQDIRDEEEQKFYIELKELCFNY